MKRLSVRTVLLTGLLLIFLSQCHLLAPVSDPNRPADKGPDNGPTTELPTSNPSNNSLSPEEAFRLDIIDYAKTFLGTDYLYAGRDPRKGFDCSGFTYFVMDEFGISLSPSSRAQEGQGLKVRVGEVQPGDLIFYRRSAASQVFHVSLVASNEPDGIYVIHSTSRGVVIDNISTSSYWSPKISSARDVVSGKF
ncbi:MAG TPA: C40 family peptidase [Saprospiraceae bacterium]|nr:C40 family peptidase [Saprospiraceae bacterium]